MENNIKKNQKIEEKKTFKKKMISSENQARKVHDGRRIRKKYRN